MFLCDLGFIGTDEMPVADDLLAADVETIDPMRAREDEPGDGIVGTAELEPVGAPDRDVGALAGRELADVVASEHRRPTTRAEPQGLPRVQRLRAAAGTRDEQRLLHLQEEIAAFVRGGAVDSQPDSDV